VNPARKVRESNFENNGLECQVQIKRYAAKIWNCEQVAVWRASARFCSFIAFCLCFVQ